MNRILFIVGILLGISGFYIIANENATDRIINFFSFICNKQLHSDFWRIGILHIGIESILFSVLILLFLKFYKTHSEKMMFISFFWIIFFFLSSVIFYSVNIPINSPQNDDYWVFLNFLNKYSTARNLNEIFCQVDDTREILRSSYAVLLFHLHSFDFKTIILFANSCLIGIMVLFYRSIFMNATHKYFLFLILTILVFQFQYYDANLCASAGSAAMCSTFFAFSSFYFLTRKSKYSFSAALLFAILCVANDRMGFIVLFIGLIMLFQMQNRKKMFGWLIISLVISILYFHNFSFDNEHHYSNWGENFSLKRISGSLIYSFIFLGSSMQFFYKTTFPLIVGVFLSGFFLFITYKKYYLSNPAVYFLILFFMSISFLLPFFREEKILQSPLSIRYSFYSIMTISSFIIAGAEIIGIERCKKLFLLTLILAFLYHMFANLLFLPEAAMRKKDLISMAHNFEQVKDSSPSHLAEKNILHTAIENKIYHIPE